MKTLVASAIALSAVFCGLNAPAQNQAPLTTQPAVGVPTAAVAAVTEPWDAFLAGFWFHAPASIDTANVRGVKLGLPISAGYGTVKGFEWSFFCGDTYNVEGFQWAMIGVNSPKHITGMQMALVNTVGAELDGLQFGLVNDCNHQGVQIGLVNLGDNADYQFGLVNFNTHGWMPFMVGFNHAR